MNAIALPMPGVTLSQRVWDLLRTVRQAFLVKQRLTPVQWAEQRRVLSAVGSARPGPFRFSVTPYLRGILDAYADSAVREIWCQKSAQVGWTDGVMNNLIGYHIEQDPCPTLVLFSKERAAKDYTREKLEPMIRATPCLSALIPLSSRNSDNTLDHKTFPGGFIKLVGSNSPSGVKSTPVRLVMVEEPDDTSDDVRGQGDSITLARDRVKTYAQSKMVVGGTPTIKSFSKIESGMLLTDRRRFFVPCHHCHEAAPLAWENVRWREDADATPHPVYGQAQPATARYYCPQCGGEWANAEKNRNVARGEWRATAPFSGVAGFYLNELYSAFPASSLDALAREWLEAVHEQRSGHVRKLITFFNTTLGEPWELKGDTPELEVLSGRALPYAEGTAPAGALLVTAGVDVQHDRLAVEIWAWGRGEESWLVYWGEIPGTVGCLPAQGVWAALDKLLDRGIASPAGDLHISAVSIDAGDGATADWVYGYVRHANKRRKRLVMAVKGTSGAHREVYSPPRERLDINHTGKAVKWGLNLYHVGVDRAKDIIMERLRAPGHGPGRLHWYEGVRDDFLIQLTSEVKAQLPGKRKVGWQKKAGIRNEGLDTAVYAMHAARRLRIHAMSEDDWTRIERGLRQPDILAASPADVPRGTSGETSSVPRVKSRAAPATSGFGSAEWSQRL